MVRKYTDWFSLFFILIASAFCYPMYFLHTFSYYLGVQMLFSMSTISLFCLAIILFRFSEFWETFLSRHIFIFFCVIIFFGFVIRQYFLYKEYSLDDLGFSLLWVTVPIFACVYAKKIKKVLPCYFFIILLFDLVLSYVHRYEQVIGIASNTNWHAIFLWVLNIFSIYFGVCIFKLSPKNKIVKSFIAITLVIVFGLLLAISIYVEILCRSKAAWLAIFIAIILFLGLELYKKNKRLFVCLFITLFIFIIIVASTFLYLPKIGKNSNKFKFATNKIEKVEQKINTTTEEDVRVPLWEGCWNLIETYPVYGVSQPYFESVYAKFRPLSYFLKPDNAVRSNHPHNSELYIAACYGFPGLIIWLILWAIPIIIGIYKYRKIGTVGKLCFYSYLIMFIHSQVDLIFFEWPTLLYSAFLLGVLWHEIWIGDNSKDFIKNSNSDRGFFYSVVLFIFKIVSLLIVLLAIKILCQYAISTYYFRLGDYAEARGEHYTAVHFYTQGLNVKENPYYSMKCAMIAEKNLDNYTLAFKYLTLFETGRVYSNYAHSNALLGSVLTKIGKPKEGEFYFYQEAVIFPLLVESWYNLYLSASAVNDKETANLASKNLSDLLRFRGLSDKAIPYLMDNYTYDAHQNMIPEKIMEEIKIKDNGRKD